MKRLSGSITILPLTKTYALYALESETDFFHKINSRLNQLYRFDDDVASEMPINKRMALRLFKEGEVLISKGDFVKAKNRLINANDLSSEPFILKALGDVCERLKEYDESTDFYKKYLNINNKDTEVLKKMAESSKKNQKFKEAHYYYKIATEVSPEERDLWHFRGLVEKRLSQQNKMIKDVSQNYLEQAIKSFKKAIKLPGDIGYKPHYNAVNLSLLAKCFLIQNRKDKARSACLLGLQENPHDLHLLEMSERHNFRIGDPLVEF